MKSNSNIFFLVAVLSTGNYLGNNPDNKKTTELYLPSSGLSCKLPSMPDARYGHTVESTGLICGGYPTAAHSQDSSCLMWNKGSWEEYLTLKVKRRKHVSWTPGSGIGTYLIGGEESPSTTTLIAPNGTQQENPFTLKYGTMLACAFEDPDTDTLIITGGLGIGNIVSVYTTLGWRADLPRLNQPRQSHACTSYTSSGKKVKIKLEECGLQGVLKLAVSGYVSG